MTIRGRILATNLVLLVILGGALLYLRLSIGSQGNVLARLTNVSTLHESFSESRFWSMDYLRTNLAESGKRAEEALSRMEGALRTLENSGVNIRLEGAAARAFEPGKNVEVREVSSKDLAARIRTGMAATQKHMQNAITLYYGKVDEIGGGAEVARSRQAWDEIAKLIEGPLAAYQREASEVGDSVGMLALLMLVLAIGVPLLLALFTVRAVALPVGRNAQSLAEASERLNVLSRQMTANAGETSNQAGVASAAAEQVSRSVQTVATGVEEMGASIKEIARSANEAAQVATTAVRVSEATNLTVSKLGDSSAQIGNVIKVITSIAEQTNLLALNATIEAARAGEAGKGFAVVANEVKELARATAKATEEIRQKIEAIQNDTKSSVAAIAQVSGIINKINDIQNTIASAVEEQTATTGEISRNLAEAVRGASDIARNIAVVAQTAQNTSHGAGDTQNAAHGLERMAGELQKLIGRTESRGSNGSGTEGSR